MTSGPILVAGMEEFVASLADNGELSKSSARYPASADEGGDRGYSPRRTPRLWHSSMSP